jgi:formylglycine-generating enzyme required for sulfatase activity
MARLLRVIRRHFPDTLLDIPLGFGSDMPSDGCDRTAICRAAAEFKPINIRSTHASVNRERFPRAYQDSLPELSGLNKTRVETRLAQAAQEPQPEGDSARVRPPPAVVPFNEKTAKSRQAGWAKYLRAPAVQTNSIGMKLALIPPGEFEMGTPKELIEAEMKVPNLDVLYKNRLPSEGPRHRVRITKPYWLGAMEVTQEEYQHVMGVNPSKFQGDPKRPVEQTSWNDAVEFCRRLSELPAEKAAKRRYVLPTEAQWEYACLAGSPGQWCFDERAGSGPPTMLEALLGEYAWFQGNSGGQTHPVGQKRPNAFGLYDMYFNAWECCLDCYDADFYSKSPTDDPAGPPGGTMRVFRGGCWLDVSPRYCRSTRRHCYTAETHYFFTGFRVSVPL